MSHRVTVGMGSNADGNTAVKWKRDEQCSLVTIDGLLFLYLLQPRHFH